MVEFGCFTWNVNIEVSFGCSAAGHGVVVVFLLISPLHSIGVPRGTANRDPGVVTVDQTLVFWYNPQFTNRLGVFLRFIKYSTPPLLNSST